jgi:prepilin-type N-terminal cleavage/methylation domain-containing protein
MRTKRGWTLIELLVVIAIIIVLMGIVYAVGMYVLEVSRQGRCTSNLRQIGVALLTYIEDHKRADWDTEIDSYAGIADEQERKALVARWGFPLPLGPVQLHKAGYLKSMDLCRCGSASPRDRELLLCDYIYRDPSALLSIPGIRQGRLNTHDDYLWKLKQEKYNYKIVSDSNHPRVRINLYLDGRVKREPPRRIQVAPNVFIEE